MAKKQPNSEVLGFRMRKEVANAVRQAAKEKKQSMQEYFLSQIDPNSELAEIIKKTDEELKEKYRLIAGAVADFIIHTAQSKERSGLSDEEFGKIFLEATNIFLKELKEESDKSKVES